MLYDDQAAHYDERVGIPDEAAAAVASAIDGIAGLHDGVTLLEPGAGTGLVSVHLLRYPVRYIGFDRSAEMLDVLRIKVRRHGFDAELAVADGNERWPAGDHAVDVIFCARALHHFDAGHFVDEVTRTLRSSAGWLIIGKVRRPHDSPKSQMRQQMRRSLADAGYGARSHDDHTERVVAALVERGAVRLEPVVAAEWRTMHRPADSIAAWASKEGLGALVIPAGVKRAVLDDVRTWALENYGDIDVPFEQVEIFQLYVVRVGLP